MIQQVEGNYGAFNWLHQLTMEAVIPDNIAWSRTNLIFTAHPVLPQIHAQLVPAAPDTDPIHQFDLAPPVLIGNSPAFYAPPRLLSFSPRDQYLFAYFPPSLISIEGGIACIWAKGKTLSSWTVTEFWKFEPGNGAVTCRWLVNEREWTSSPSGNLIRGPPLGPSTPGSATLLVITQFHEAHLCIQSPNSAAGLFFNRLHGQLRRPSEISQIGQNIPHHLLDSDGGVRVCIRAAIGLSYDESSILVATQSAILPLPPGSGGSEFSLGFSTPVSIATEDSELNWELWGEENLLEICQLDIDTSSHLQSLTTTPLFSLALFAGDPAPPVFQGQLRTISFSPIHIRPWSQESESQATHKSNGFTLLVSSVGLEDSPSSHVKTWEIRRRKAQRAQAQDITAEGSDEVEASGVLFTSESSDVGDAESTGSIWISTLKAHRVFENDLILTATRVSSDDSGILVSLIRRSLDTSGDDLRPKASDMGEIRRLNSDLSDSQDYESVPIICKAAELTKHIPVSLIPSPNGMLLCRQSGLYVPHRLSILGAPSETSENHPVLRHLSSALALSLLRSNDPTDIVRGFWQRLTSYQVPEFVSIAVDILASVDKGEKEKAADSVAADMKVEAGANNGRVEADDLQTWILPIMGVLVLVYKNCPDPQISPRWHTAFDYCQFVACERSFEECIDADNGKFDTAASWHLMSLSRWFMEQCENIVREAVLWQARRRWKGKGVEDLDDADDLAYVAPILILILHPQPLTVILRILSHIERLRALFATVPVPAQNAQLHLAKITLGDTVEGSNIRLDPFASALKAAQEYLAKSIQETSALNTSLLMSLLALTPQLAISAHLAHITQSLATHQPPIFTDKTRLLVPLTDFLDVPPYSITSRENTRDVISKGVIKHSGAGVKVCTRCGSVAERRWLDDGKTRTASISANGNGNRKGTTGGQKWQAFEGDWEAECICGGKWITKSRI